MRAVTASFIGFCFMIPSAWAVEFLLSCPGYTASSYSCSSCYHRKHLLRALLHSRPELFQQLRQLLRLFSRLRKSRSLQRKLPSRKPSKMPKSSFSQRSGNASQQLEKANLEALSQNQELQLKNDNLGVQVQVLQSERSAQMFLYGAATLAVGVLLGFLIASYVYTKRRRQW